MYDKWMKLGDRMNKYFFSLIKEWLAEGLDDIAVSSTADLTRAYNTFYSKVYATLVPDEQWEEFVRNYEVMSHVDSHLEACMKLEVPIME